MTHIVKPSQKNLRDIVRVHRPAERVRVELVETRRGRRAIADPDPFLGRAGRTILWTSKYPFSVAFDTPKPIYGAPARAAESASSIASGPDGPMHYIVARARTDAETGLHFKYVLTVWDEESQRLYVSDPTGDIDPDPETETETERDHLEMIARVDPSGDLDRDPDPGTLGD